ncbi:MAG TPA: SAP domain-containing protein [Cyclobacteriaceae bacterium]|nr:SAP domain-containing protein [Cyclobacteriaceae bacterium]
MFNLFNRKKDWKNSPAHLLLLSKFLTTNSPDRYANDEHWKSVLKEKPSKVISQFLKEKILESVELQELVDYKFKILELKETLKTKGLKISGRKEELIQRLIENDPQLMHEKTKDLVLYRCTKEGMQFANRYLEEERAVKNKVEHDVMNYLKNRQYLKASQLIVKYKESQVFYFIQDNVNGLTRDLKPIFEVTPDLLSGVDKMQLDQLRLAAGMMLLWGSGNVRSWIPDNIVTGIHLDGPAICRMLIFHSNHLKNIDSYRGKVKTVEISGIDDVNTCPACKKIHGKKFKLGSVPQLPYAKCTCDLGCRCRIDAKEWL